MLARLIETYFAHWGFVVLHAGLLAWAAVAFLRSKGRIAQHLRALDAVPSQRQRDISTDSWGMLLQRRANPRGEPGDVPFAEVRDQYSALLASYVDELAGVANLLLLTGVVGTLYGLYSGFAQAPEAGWSSSLAGAFDAFGVTIAAVALAALVLVLQRLMARTCDLAAIEISARWPALRAAEQRPAEVQVMERLDVLTAQLQPLVARMEQHADRVLQERELLDRVTESCTALQVSVAALPAGLRAALEEDRAGYQAGLRELGAAWHAHQHMAQEDAARLSALTRNAHELYLGELAQVRGQNRALFDEIKAGNHQAFLEIGATIGNLDRHVAAVDQSAEQLLSSFSARVTEIIARHATLLDSRLASLRDVAPQVERDLQLLGPTAASAAQLVEHVQAAAADSVAHVHQVVRDLAAALAGLRERIDALPALERAATPATSPPEPPAPGPLATLQPRPAVASAPPAPPQLATAASPRGRLPTLVVVGMLSAAAGGLITSLFWAA